LLVFLLAVALSAPAGAADRIVARAYLEDASGKLTFEEARHGIYTPYSGVLNRGYSASAFWLRLTIAPDTGTAEPAPAPEYLVLRVRPAFLDDVELFDPLHPGVTPRRTGDRHPWQADEAHTVTPGFILPHGTGTRDVWLRLRTTSSAIIDVTALPHDEAAREEANLLLGAAAYIGAMALLACWGLLQWLLIRRFVIIVFCAKQVAASVQALGAFGLSRFLLDGILVPDTIDTVTSASAIALAVTGLTFHGLFLLQYRPARWTMAALALLVSAELLGFLLFMLGATQLGISLNAKAATLGIALTPVAAATTRGHDDGNAAAPNRGGYIRKPVLVGIYVTEFAGVLLVTLPLLGLVVPPALALVNVQIWVLFTGLMMMAVLQLETVIAIRERNEAAVRARLAEQQAEEQVKLRQEKADFLSMLSHEMRTSLAVLSLTLTGGNRSPESTATVQETIGSMNAVIERCLQASQLEEGGITQRHEPCDLVDIVRIAAQRPDLAGRVVLEGPPSVVLRSDDELLRVIVANLLDNAAKYSPPGSTIEIGIHRTAQEQDRVEAVFSNMPGPVGWPDASSIFKKYVRGASARHTTGSGLGLYIVEKISGMLGGSIQYRPSRTHIRFVLSLPIAADMPGEGEAVSSS
jgi:signal transduction histidine kinase